MQTATATALLLSNAGKLGGTSSISGTCGRQRQPHGQRMASPSRRLRMRVAPSMDTPSLRLRVEHLAATGEPEDAALIHAGRNRVWSASWDGQSVIIKRFGPGNVWKQLLGILRPGKALRTFATINRMQAAGIQTPDALAAVSAPGLEILVCAHQGHVGTAATCRGHADRLRALGEFIASMFVAQVQHRDLNAGNLLLITADPPCFAVIDCNRVRFRRSSGWTIAWLLLRLGMHAPEDAEPLLSGMATSPGVRRVYRILIPINHAWWRMRQLTRPWRRRVGF